MHAIQKRTVGYVLGAAVCALLIVPALLGFSHPVSAAAPAPGATGAGAYFDTTTQGTDTTAGATFAGTAGLGQGDLISGIAKVIQTAMGFLGIIAVIIILLGGFKWMTAGGNDEKVKKAKALIFQGIIGLVIILAAYSIAQFAISQITTVTNAT